MYRFFVLAPAPFWASNSLTGSRIELTEYLNPSFLLNEQKSKLIFPDGMFDQER